LLDSGRARSRPSRPASACAIGSVTRVSTYSVVWMSTACSENSGKMSSPMRVSQ
jgi:hypothetical protein